MNQINLRARAKINLALDVLGKRADGYHDLRMVMQSLCLYDSIVIKKVNKPRYLKVASNLPWLPLDERNLAYRAAALLIEAFGIEEGVFIGLEKRIPVSAGLAGGSSDCAAVLVGMRRLFSLPLTTRDLMALGKTLGADVPYCVMRGTALAEGIGDKLTRLPPLPRAHVLLAKPPHAVSTAEVFGAYHGASVARRPDIEKMLYYIEAGDLANVCAQFCNVLESVTIEKHPVIGALKECMLENGAMAALMSGSGPSVFGFFATRPQAVAAARTLRGRFPQVREVFATEVFNVYGNLD